MSDKPGHQIGDAPIQQEYRDKMQMMARVLDELLNDAAKGSARETGFVLLVFPFGSTDGRCNFISNGADRADIVTLFREMIARFEGQPQMSGRA